MSRLFRTASRANKTAYEHSLEVTVDTLTRPHDAEAESVIAVLHRGKKEWKTNEVHISTPESHWGEELHTKTTLYRERSGVYQEKIYGLDLRAVKTNRVVARFTFDVSACSSIDGSCAHMVLIGETTNAGNCAAGGSGRRRSSKGQKDMNYIMTITVSCRFLTTHHMGIPDGRNGLSMTHNPYADADKHTRSRSLGATTRHGSTGGSPPRGPLSMAERRGSDTGLPSRLQSPESDRGTYYSGGSENGRRRSLGVGLQTMSVEDLGLLGLSPEKVSAAGGQDNATVKTAAAAAAAAKAERELLEEEKERLKKQLLAALDWNAELQRLVDELTKGGTGQQMRSSPEDEVVADANGSFGVHDFLAKIAQLEAEIAALRTEQVDLLAQLASLSGTDPAAAEDDRVVMEASQNEGHGDGSTADGSIDNDAEVTAKDIAGAAATGAVVEAEKGSDEAVLLKWEVERLTEENKALQAATLHETETLAAAKSNVEATVLVKDELVLPQVEKLSDGQRHQLKLREEEMKGMLIDESYEKLAACVAQLEEQHREAKQRMEEENAEYLQKLRAEQLEALQREMEANYQHRVALLLSDQSSEMDQTEEVKDALMREAELNTQTQLHLQRELLLAEHEVTKLRNAELDVELNTLKAVVEELKKEQLEGREKDRLVIVEKDLEVTERRDEAERVQVRNEELSAEVLILTSTLETLTAKYQGEREKQDNYMTAIEAAGNELAMHKEVQKGKDKKMTGEIERMTQLNEELNAELSVLRANIEKHEQATRQKEIEKSKEMNVDESLAGRERINEDLQMKAARFKFALAGASNSTQKPAETSSLAYRTGLIPVVEVEAFNGPDFHQDRCYSESDDDDGGAHVGSSGRGGGGDGDGDDGGGGYIIRSADDELTSSSPTVKQLQGELQEKQIAIDRSHAALMAVKGQLLEMDSLENEVATLRQLLHDHNIVEHPASVKCNRDYGDCDEDHSPLSGQAFLLSPPDNTMARRKAKQEQKHRDFLKWRRDSDDNTMEDGPRAFATVSSASMSGIFDGVKTLDSQKESELAALREKVQAMECRLSEATDGAKSAAAATEMMLRDAENDNTTLKAKISELMTQLTQQQQRGGNTVEERLREELHQAEAKVALLETKLVDGKSDFIFSDARIEDLRQQLLVSRDAALAARARSEAAGVAMSQMKELHEALENCILERDAAYNQLTEMGAHISSPTGDHKSFGSEAEQIDSLKREFALQQAEMGETIARMLEERENVASWQKMCESLEREQDEMRSQLVNTKMQFAMVNQELEALRHQNRVHGNGGRP